MSHTLGAARWAAHLTTRGRLIAGTLFVLAIWLVVGALPAYAGDLRVRAHIKGAGLITYNFTSETCDLRDQQDERASTYCGQKVRYGAGHVDGTITATAATAPEGDWSFAGWENCPSPSGNQCYMRSPFWEAGNYEPTAVFVDGRAPVFTLGATQYPGGRSVRVPFSAHETLSDLQCQLDHGGWAPCADAGFTQYTGLSEGQHSLRVAGADRSGQWGYSDVSHFRIVDTALAPGPRDPSNSRQATFHFSSVGGSQFRCRVDGGSWFECVSPTTVTVPTDGAHTFRVQAFDGAVDDPDPAERSWTVDTVPPETTLDPAQGPPAHTKVQSETARFEFSSEAGATFRCRVDSGAWQACTSPRVVSGLVGGNHTFAVAATDLAGNTDPTPDTRSWIAVVDKDNDGSLSDVDCNDRNASVHPGAVDIPDNAADEDCDGRPAINYDRDRDGHRRPEGGGRDCNDKNPAIHPGAVDIPGNAIDEDCKDGPAPPDSLATDIRPVWRVSGKRTQLISLTAVSVSRNTTITVTCRGKGKAGKKACPKRKTYTITTDRPRVDIAGKLAGRWLKPKTKVEVRVSRPGMRGVLERYKTRTNTLPASHEGCLPAGPGDHC